MDKAILVGFYVCTAATSNDVDGFTRITADLNCMSTYGVPPQTLHLSNYNESGQCIWKNPALLTVSGFYVVYEQRMGGVLPLTYYITESIPAVINK